MVTHDQIDFSTNSLIRRATMQVMQLLQEYLEKSLSTIHVKRIKRVLLTVESLLMRAKLTVTALGRHTKGEAFVKHKIKAVDRIMANPRLLPERIEFYKAIAHKLIGPLKQIDIIVDWSPGGNHENHILRASLALAGRSAVIYEEVHPQKLLGKHRVHRKFLNNLAKVLPLAVRPVIVTDAGFRADWFLLVTKQGWDFEGRICNNMLYKLDDDGWQGLAKLYAKATKIAKYIGTALLTKTNKLPCAIYVYRGAKIAGKKVRTKTKKRSKNFAKEVVRYRRQHQQPWVLVTSITTNNNPKKVVARYARRMKIEHEFRNNKNTKWGLGLNATRTRNPARLSILLLIAAIAMLALYLIGVIAEKKLMHYRYQVNSIKNRRVLSLIFLGLQVIEHDLAKISIAGINNAFKFIYQNESKYYASNEC